MAIARPPPRVQIRRVAVFEYLPISNHQHARKLPRAKHVVSDTEEGGVAPCDTRPPDELLTHAAVQTARRLIQNREPDARFSVRARHAYALPFAAAEQCAAFS